MQLNQDPDMLVRFSGVSCLSRDGYAASRIVFCRDMQLLMLHLRNWRPARMP